MKKLFSLLVIGVLSLAIAGCTTFKPTAYKTLKTTADTVDIAMKAYAEALVTPGSNIGSDTQIKVQELHGQFQKVFRQAVTAAQFDLATAPPAEVAALAAEIATLIATYVK